MSLLKGEGIIATREKFLKFLKTKQGMEELADVKNLNRMTIIVHGHSL